ncbi:MAG TPA: hypothetical protein EYP59_15120 [Thiotrichaceae bacterium]|nr:hypothetical protein [Thiotrichaceae bacterium]
MPASTKRFFRSTLKVFEQSKVYGIITDGVEWAFYLLENSVLTADRKGCYISNVSGIIDRIGEASPFGIETRGIASLQSPLLLRYLG